MPSTRIQGKTIDFVVFDDVEWGMANMFRLNPDGTVDRCDDTPDPVYKGPKYKRSMMREGRWVINYYDEANFHHVKYIDESQVPDIIKMFDLLEP